MSQTRRLLSLFAVLLVGRLVAPPTMATDAAPTKPVGPGPVPLGQPFPAKTYANLNPGAGGAAQIDLTQVLGHKPILLHYWIAGNIWSEEVFQQLQTLVDQIGPDKIALYGVAVPRPGLEADAIRERLTALAIHAPVIDDEGFGIGTLLHVDSVPNITIIDRSGRLRLTNGASLLQVLGYKINLETAIRRTAETGDLMTYGVLERYFPVRELEGRPCPDFTAPLLTTNVEQHWSSLLDAQKINVLIFWSVDCPHCRKSLPEINQWLREHPDGVNVISAANCPNDTTRTKTLEFCKVNDFKFPTLVDKDAEIGRLFRVTSTPTILIIGPDGIVDSVILSGHSGFGQIIEDRKRKLLKTTG